MTAPRTRVWRSRAMIIAIVLSSVVPFALAWHYARHPELIQARSNYGNLFIPPLHEDWANLWTKPLGRGEQLPALKGRWLLLQVTTGPCDEACRSIVRKTHQARLMLNKETLRVRRVLLVVPGTTPESLAPLLAQDEDVVVVESPARLLQTVTTALQRPPASDSVFLVDPLGNLVLWYEPGFDPYRLVKDIKHLLKASQIG